MIEPSKIELEHAVRYATEATKVFMMERYRKRYPEYFDHAVMITRPAKLSDYYIPKSIAGKCLVVQETYFEETGCLRLACFPFKEDGQSCQKEDEPRMVPFGKTFIPACQHACSFDNNLDLEWWINKCVAVNPYKKLLAMLPEQVFGRTSKHDLHNGLDWIDGNVRLNRTYCEAYGLDFDGKDCTLDTGQYVAEIILGKTIYRAIKIATSSSKPVAPPVPPTLPAHLVYRSSKPLDRLVSVDETTVSGSQLAAEIATELAVDFGIDATGYVVEKILKKKAPKLLTKAASNVALKSALKQAVLQVYTKFTIGALQMTGKVVGAATEVLALYSVIALVLDIFDPYEFDKVLDLKQLEEISNKIDLRYFGRETNFNAVVTPEYVWDNVLGEEDQSDKIEFMAERIEEYVTALHASTTSGGPAASKLSLFNFNLQVQMERRMHWMVHVSIIFALIVVGLSMVQWINVMAPSFFFGCLYVATM